MAIGVAVAGPCRKGEPMASTDTSERIATIRQAEIRLPTNNLADDLPFYSNTLGFRLDRIYPADNPAVAVMSGHGLRIRIERGASEAPGTIRLLCDDPDALAGGKRELVAPNGTRIEIVEANPPMVVPPTQHAFMVRHLRDGDPWVIGRAGMHYRDLLPGRLGGSIIASHIRIPQGGPVPDMVHYHTVGFQLIFCLHGWVRLVYEDQGAPFILAAGDCVIQPPEIRHRVLESGDGLEVIEIGVPAEHMTTIDHEMELPNRTVDPAREFQGQRFIRHEAAKAVRQPFRIDGFSMRDTGIAAATRGVAGVQVARPEPGWQPDVTSHDTDILFDFVMSGHMTLAGEGQEERRLKPGDAFVIPPAMKTVYRDCTDDLELLEVCLPGAFTTTHHEHLEG